MTTQHKGKRLSEAELEQAFDTLERFPIRGVGSQSIRQHITWLEAKVKTMEEALQNISDVAYDAQGDYSAVMETYSPEWTHAYKDISAVAKQALSPEPSVERGEQK